MIRIPTTGPAETIGRAINFFKEQENNHGPLNALGVAAFGPLDPVPGSPKYGYITTTPKPGWNNTDFIGTLTEEFNLPVGFDTDVNGAALAEYLWGAANDLTAFIYLTVGTGIGGGLVFKGQIHHGLMHPEIGHIFIPHNWQNDPFPGSCPYHGDCLEGLASGLAIKERWGQPGSELSENHPAWQLEAKYLALALCNLILTISPERIIIGGGIMRQPCLLPLIRKKVQVMLNRYNIIGERQEQIASYIVAPLLGDMAGVLGALALAELAEKRL